MQTSGQAFDHARHVRALEVVFRNPELARELFRGSLNRWLARELAEMVLIWQTRAFIDQGFEDYRRQAGYTVWASRD